ncbi:MAG TPA: DUF6785 family protein [Armatimonadota bacterium]|nr:DUF6785 family protein [Armatimonadota bacterium]
MVPSTPILHYSITPHVNTGMTHVADKQGLRKPSSEQTRSGLSFRAVLIGLILVAITCFVVSWGELVVARIQIGFLQMPPAVIGIFFMIMLLNKGMQRIKRGLGITSGELMMVYCMMLVASMISSRGVMEKILPTLLTPNYFANATNRWQETFFPHIKKWLVPFDPQGGPKQFVAERFWERLRTGETIPWSLWITPLAAWGILVLIVIFAFLCLATILRRQWVDNEKLSFPLIQPALELVRDDQASPLLKNRLLWGGMLLPVLVFGFNGLHNWYPNIPEIALSKVLNDFLVNPPWKGMYFTPVYFSFAAIGFFYLLPSELLFSIWFFTLFARLQDVTATAFNMEPESMPMYGAPLFISYQTVGAYLVLAGYLVYVSAPHLRKVLKAALFREKVDDSQELMPYSVAFWGLIICLLASVGWCVLAGMSPWVALLEFGVFIFIIALVMARSTAEAGMLMTETTFRPMDLYRLFAPVHSLGPANMTMLAFLDTHFLRDQRGLLLTGFLDGLKISDGANVRRRSFLPIFVIGVVAALVIACVIQIWLPYHRGGNTLYYWIYGGSNMLGFWEYQAHMQWAGVRSWQAPVFFGVGIVFTIFLSYMRAMFPWWPLHPLGYALCVSWTTTVFWFSCFMAWVIKGLFLRYGGMRFYMRARPWFLGMVLGEFGMAVVWTLISAATGAPTPSFPWP